MNPNKKIYDKYLRKYDQNAPENIKMRKIERAEKIKRWLKDHTFDIINSVIGLVALIVAIIALILQ